MNADERAVAMAKGVKVVEGAFMPRTDLPEYGSFYLLEGNRSVVKWDQIDQIHLLDSGHDLLIDQIDQCTGTHMHFNISARVASSRTEANYRAIRNAMGVDQSIVSIPQDLGMHFRDFAINKGLFSDDLKPVEGTILPDESIIRISPEKSNSDVEELLGEFARYAAPKIGSEGWPREAPFNRRVQ